jgi:hypothetical protein
MTCLRPYQTSSGSHLKFLRARAGDQDQERAESYTTFSTSFRARNKSLQLFQNSVEFGVSVVEMG